MLNYKLTVGVVTIRRYIAEPPKRIGIFQSDYAVDNKNAVLRHLRENYEDEQTKFVDIEWLNEEGLLRLDSDCDKVAEHFKREGVNALFIVNCNFGQESCAGSVARKLGLPTLLWGPRDRVFDFPQRYTDTQCGLFSMSKQLKRNGVKFSYIENCDITDAAFDKGIKQFFSVACMVNNFKNMRILQVGSRVAPFKCVMYNELELCEKFGTDVVAVNLANMTVGLQKIYAERQADLEKELVQLKTVYDCTGHDDETLKKTLAIVLYLEDLAKANDCNVMSLECWTGVSVAWGIPPCHAMSILADRGVYVACESDMHMAITNVLLMSASRGKGAPLQGEFTTRHPENDNAELLWHCGPFPASACKEGCKPKLCASKPYFRVKDGEYTLARFQTDNGKYYLLAGSFQTCEGPDTYGTYMWAEFKDLPKLERKFVEGPYIHHVTEIYGNYVEELKEFCKYVDVTFDPLED